jgi:hypothetical protein
MHARRRFLILACLVSTALGLGCATAGSREALPLIPSRTVTRAGPYRIWTHEPRPADDPALVQLVALQRRLETDLALRLDPERTPIDIFILQDRSAFEHFLTFYYPDLPPRRAFFLAREDRRQVYTYRGPHIVEDLRHEATHALLHASVAELPLWLDEGLAEYYEVPDDRAGLNGEHLARFADDRGEGWTPQLERLEALRDVREMSPRDYRESWAWVHYLLNGPKPNRMMLLEYLADLRERPDAAPLSTRLGAEDVPPGRALLAHLDRLRERPPVRTVERPAPAYVLRGQDPAPDPPRRRSLLGRFLGLLGF